jgi:glycosyltransferase involved in cell wall biosynthesis
MRIAIVYDCLSPHTVGGAERWYRNVAERLGAEHEVVYLTRRQWGTSGPGTPFETIAVSPGGELYTATGRRRIRPALRFGWGVFRELVRDPEYDAVHTASFPYFSVIAATAALRLRRSRASLVVDWHEYWSATYWRRYLGPVGGRLGRAVQSLCRRLAARSFTFSRLVEARLRADGYRRPLTMLRGQYSPGPGARGGDPSAPRPPLAVFAGRHIPEKRVLAVPPAIVVARREQPALRCLVLGDGPETEALRRMVGSLGLEDVVEVRGRVDAGEVADALSRAACLVHPSEREGYGLVVVEAAAAATPVVLTAAPENAAVELVEPGVNGRVAAGAEPEVLGAAIAGVVAEGAELRQSTAAWFTEHAAELSLESSLAAIEAAYSP